MPLFKEVGPIVLDPQLEARAEQLLTEIPVSFSKVRLVEDLVAPGPSQHNSASGFTELRL